MIVRINQIDAALVGPGGGWPADGFAGPIRAAWPAGAAAFELLILSEDERKQPLTDAFRQQQLRQMLPQVAIALAPADAASAGAAAPAGAAAAVPAGPVVVRLDGPVAEGELLPAWRHLTDADGTGRYAFSRASRTTADPAPPVGSVRVAAGWRSLARLCGDPAVGLERHVRLRLFAVPPGSVSAALDAADPDDPRWPGLLGECGLYVGTPPGLTGLHLVVRGLDAAKVKARVLQRLLAVARGEPAIPAGQ